MAQSSFDSVPVQLTDRILKAERDIRDLYLIYGNIITSNKAPLVLGGHGNGATVVAGGTAYVVPTIAGLDTVGRSWPFPLPATAGKLYFRLASAQPASGSLDVVIIDVTLAISTGIGFSIPAGSPGATYTDLVNTYTWTAGNLIACMIVNNALSASGIIGGVSWRMDTALV